MALIPIHSSVSTRYEDPPAPDTTKLKGKDITAFEKGHRYCCSFYGDFRHHATVGNSRKLRTGAGVFSLVCKRIEMPSNLPLQKETLYASESTSTEKQIGALNSYFQKLQQTSSVHPQDSYTALKVEQSPTETIELLDSGFDTKKELTSLENYLGKLNASKTEKNISTSGDNIDFGRDGATERMIHLQSQSKDINKSYPDVSQRLQPQKETSDLYLEANKPYPEISQGLQPQEETSGLYLVCVLASINIAVFLFEIASPVKNSDIEFLTLPSLYGAKINQLILDGEWWRLVTPMFLHSGIFHVALGSWVLLTFGPRVCKGYGSFTFLLIYILGGIAGNLTSYIHTPEPTVGGTGPVFAIIGAWIIYQIQNKDFAQKDISESMYRKAIIATALSFVLSNFGPIDDWTHLGATFVGVAYGYLNCPTLQLDDVTSKTDQKDKLALTRQHAGPCKSIATFAIFLGIMSSLLLFVEPQVTHFL